MKARKVVICLLLGIAALGLCLVVMAVLQPGWEFVIDELCTVDNIVGAPIYSSDDFSVAWITQVGEDFAVVHNGEAGQAYTDLAPASIKMSPDGDRIAYAAGTGRGYLNFRAGEVRPGYAGVLEQTNKSLAIAGKSPEEASAHVVERGQSWTVVVDGEANGPYEDVRADSLVFSDDGKHVAYEALTEEGWVAVVDGVAGPPCDLIMPGIFSPDGSRFAYSAVPSVEARRVVVFVDGAPGTKHDNVAPEGWAFSPDSKHLAYPAQDGATWTVVVDGEAGPAFDVILDTGPIFSDDSAHYAYAAELDGERMMVLDGEPGMPHTGIPSGAFVYSPDGKRYAYAAIGDDDRPLVVTDGKPGEAYDGIREGSLSFSPDGLHVAYAAMIGGRWFAVLDGKRGPEFDEFGGDSPLFTPLGDHLLYIAKQGESWHMVQDDVPGPAFDGIAKSSPRFAEDGTRIGYIGVRGEKTFVVVDGKEEPAYDAVCEKDPAFSPDSRQVAYAGKTGDTWRVYVNGAPGPEGGKVVSGPTFFTDKGFFYLALNGLDLVRVTAMPLSLLQRIAAVPRRLVSPPDSGQQQEQ